MNVVIPKTNSFPNAENVRCDNCIAFVPVKAPGAVIVGQCRVNAPTVVIVPARVAVGGGNNMNVQTAFPPVIGEAWCMQFKPRPVGMEPHPPLDQGH